MNNDLKATLTGLVTAVAGTLSYFGVMLPESWQGPIVFVGVLVLSFFTNKKSKTGV